MSQRPVKRVRCAIYTRVSTEYGLEQDFNSLDAQHDAAEAFVRSQALMRLFPKPASRIGEFSRCVPDRLVATR